MDRKDEIDLNQMWSSYQKYESNIDPKLAQGIREYMGNSYREKLLQKKEIEQKELDQVKLNCLDNEIEKAKEKAEEQRKKIIETRHNRQIQLYKRGIDLALGGLTIAVILVTTPLGGKIVEATKTVSESILESVNQFKDNIEKEAEYNNMSIEEQVYNSTGMTPEEIMSKGKSH